jgi:threonine synthase
MEFQTRSIYIASQLLKQDLPSSTIEFIIQNAFNFPIHVRQITSNIYALELFWGPTLAFKDFGARFMASALNAVTDEPITIVTATSGDTGAAVAHAFYNVPNVDVNILYPHKRISELQEKLFCTLGGNIRTFAVKGDFDDCQALVKNCFADTTLGLNLNSSNSINVSRVLAQSFYYFEALARLPNLKNCVVSVPSGNFGNLTAGLFARQMGLPISAFVAATNANDTVPRYLTSGLWQPNQTNETISNAMDVSRPNNWPRIEEYFYQHKLDINHILRGVSVSENQTKQAMKELQELGYIADPHSAIAYFGLKNTLKENEFGVFLCTAHPAKFKKSVDDILKIDVELPGPLKAVVNKEITSFVIENNYDVLRQYLVDKSKI